MSLSFHIIKKHFHFPGPSWITRVQEEDYQKNNVISIILVGFVKRYHLHNCITFSIKYQQFSFIFSFSKFQCDFKYLSEGTFHISVFWKIYLEIAQSKTFLFILSSLPFKYYSNIWLCVKISLKIWIINIYFNCVHCMQSLKVYFVL